MSCNSTTGFLFCVYFCYSSPFGDGAPAFLSARVLCAICGFARFGGKKKPIAEAIGLLCLHRYIDTRDDYTQQAQQSCIIPFLSPIHRRFTGFSQLLFFTQKVPLQSSGLGLKVMGLASLGRKCNRHHAGLGTKRIIP